MSQASKRKAQRLVREREQVARFIAENVTVRIGHDEVPPYSPIRRAPRVLLTGRGKFDVHAAREAALALVALEVEQAVFEDWCRQRGKGPENREPGAFVSRLASEVFDINVLTSGEGRYSIGVGDEEVSFVASEEDGPTHVAQGLATAVDANARLVTDGYTATVCDDVITVSHQGRPVAGGWPGNLAREYAWDMCPNECEPAQELGDIRSTGPAADLGDSDVSLSYSATPGRWVRLANGKVCDVCTNGRVRHGDRDPRAPMGRRLAKLGRAVLRAMGGQPGECMRCGGCGFSTPNERYEGEAKDENCPDCHGTGHNLRGVLPPIECQPQLLRRMHEDEGGYHDDAMAPWLVALGQTPMLRPLATPGPIDEAEPAISHVDALELMGPDGVDGRTRVVPRGEHRDLDDLAPSLAEFASGLGLKSRLPSWRRGEIRHADQRKERRARAEPSD